jgi:hypothetical protein
MSAKRRGMPGTPIVATLRPSAATTAYNTPAASFCQRLSSSPPRLTSHVMTVNGSRAAAGDGSKLRRAAAEVVGAGARSYENPPLTLTTRPSGVN